MSASTEAGVRNRLLAALPAEEYKRLAAHLEPVSLTLSQVLFRAGDRTEYAFFPGSAIISLLTDLSEGFGIEVGLVGQEGMAGVSVVLEAETESKVATVQGEGTAMRIKASALREEMKRGGRLQTFLLQYTHALMSQISQSVVCNIRHKVEGRLARWLLMYQDRTESDDLTLTHEFISNMLGIRRSSVSEVAGKLQQAGLIGYRRGHIRILNRGGLEEITCECYPVIKTEFDRLYRR